jgi:curli biogenesis system outer membrane secretion channel CsgG
MTRTRSLLLAAIALLALPAPAQTLGKGGSLATGGAGPDGSAQGANDQLERCDSPKGTLAVVEPQTQMQANLQRYGLGSPTGVIRMLVQQSNCFQVVERGVGMRNMMQERALGQSGELQSDQNIGKGQMVAADFIVTPTVVFSENNAGGMGGAIGGLLGGRARALAGVAGGLKFKQAETSMLLVDSRSGIQVAAAQGSAEKADFAIGGAVLGGLSAAGGGYSNTNEGKVVVASFLDNWNNIVRNIRNNPSLVQAKAGAASQRNAAMSVRANAGAAGDVMYPKINGVKVLRQPRDGSGDVQTLSKSDEVLLLGEEQNGFVKVTSSRGEGWVKAILLSKR